MALAVAVAVALLAWPGAEAQDSRVTTHKSAAQGSGGRHAKAASIEQLCRIDSSAARTAIKELADDANDMTAVTAT